MVKKRYWVGTKIENKENLQPDAWIIFNLPTNILSNKTLYLYLKYLLILFQKLNYILIRLNVNMWKSIIF